MNIRPLILIAFAACLPFLAALTFGACCAIAIAGCRHTLNAIDPISPRQPANITAKRN